MFGGMSPSGSLLQGALCYLPTFVDDRLADLRHQNLAGTTCWRGIREGQTQLLTAIGLL